jgi:hypothetical protein
LTSTLTSTPGVSLTGGDAPTLLGILDILTADRCALAGWLRTFDDKERAARVANRSYWHANGFAKLVLQAGADHRVRLHVWPAGDGRLGESNPHDHRWDFASTVLCGDGLENVYHRESEVGLSYTRYRYEGGRAGGLLTHVGDVCLWEIDRLVTRTHERYMLDTSIVHTVRPLGTSLVATLVVHGPARRESAVVYCAPGVPADESVTVVSVEEVRDLIRGVLAALDAG